ncbi:Transcriptional regulator AglR, LacI family [Candidatus Rhodobacter oscarellae]|uniref:Transcriptional regulator AglR, LacI family n=1 Tax=Candidatus Rhodobacter oscarellae TaxID=1675527 RepID=A0A0J9E3I4_9RHOB|nr:substrate-binding domain-containing protein [Candidatus Rhodobacter lobularis]KMW57381.1 Transcriptional regulator AglR, LacI family [Candidatus Rhodobacter lobularis]
MNLKELSDSLGLSQTTVSRALNGYPEVAEATRIRVAQAAAAANYRPNARARGLATGRSMAVGHVIPISTHHEMVNPIFSDFIAGASEVYLDRGYDMVISAVPDEREEEAYRALLSKGSVDGVIVHAPRSLDPRIALLREIGLPFVVHGRSTNEPGPYNWVDVNNRSAFLRATEFLMDLGHRRIGLINGLLAMDFAARRHQGYVEALHSRGIAADETLIHTSEMTEAQGYAAAKQMLALPAPPTAFLGASIISAFGIRRAIEDSGLVLGRDVSVITFDDDLSYLRDASDVPTFTATRSSVREAGRICADRLMSIIADPAQPPVEHLLEAALTVGRSTGPAPRGTTQQMG